MQPRLFLSKGKGGVLFCDLFYMDRLIFYCSAIKMIIMAMPLIGAYGRKNSREKRRLFFYSRVPKLT